MLYGETPRQAPNVVGLSGNPRSAGIVGYTLRGRRPGLTSSVSERWPGLWGAASAGARGYLTRSRDHVFTVVVALGGIQKSRTGQKSPSPEGSPARASYPDVRGMGAH